MVLDEVQRKPDIFHKKIASVIFITIYKLSTSLFNLASNGFTHFRLHGATRTGYRMSATLQYNKMSHVCNIDARGKAIRMAVGWIFLLASLVLGLAAWLLVRYWLWVPMGGSFAVGGAALYEAANRWCVLRAMGIKTPL